MDKEKENKTESPSFEIVVNGHGAEYDTPEKAKIREKARSHNTNSNPVVITPAKPLAERRKDGRKKLRVAGYCRVSTPSEAQVSSIENQKAHFIKLAAEPDDWKFVGIFADEGISGTYLKKRKSLLSVRMDKRGFPAAMRTHPNGGFCFNGKTDRIFIIG